MNLDKPLFTARQLYGILDETARVLENCVGIDMSDLEAQFASELRNRVVNEILLALETQGYPVEVVRFVGQDEVATKHRLAAYFRDGEYGSAREAITEIAHPYDVGFVKATLTYPTGGGM
jgi:hypothetical protein